MLKMSMEQEYNTAERYRVVRKHLDDLGYRQALSLDALPLIERLLADLIQTTESLKHFKTVAQENIEACSHLQLAAEPYKCDNARLVQECNQLHLNLLETKETHQKQIKDLRKHVRRLESECNDLQLASSRNLKKIKDLEVESAGKSSKILELLGKCCKPVISNTNLATKKRACYPLRRPTLESDPLPRTGSSSATLPNSSSVDPNVVDLLEMADHRMSCLNREVTILKGELSEQADNVHTLKTQLVTKEKEIMRLRKMLEGGRPYTAVTKDCFCKKLDKNYPNETNETRLLQQVKLDLEQQLKEALSKQHEAMSQALKLAERNEELEKELRDIDHIALAVEADCNSAVQENNRRVSRLQEKLEDVMTQVHVLESELTVERREVQELRADLEASKLEKRNVQRVLESTLDEKKQMTDRINQLTVIEKEMSEEIENLTKDCKNLKREIAELESTNNILKGQMHAVGSGGDDVAKGKGKGEKNDKNKGKRIPKKKPASKGQTTYPLLERRKTVDLSREEEVSKDMNYGMLLNTENQKVENEKDTTITSLTKTIERLQTERDYYRNEYNKFREQFNKGSDGDNADLWTQACELRRQLNEKEQSITVLQREKKELCREKFNLEAKLQTSKSQQRRSCISCSQCSPRRPVGPCTCPPTSPPIGDTSASKAMLERLERERDTARADIERLVEERDALRERLKMAAEAHTCEQRRLRESLCEAETRLKQLERERQDFLVNQGTRRATINGLEDQLEDMRQELRKTKEELTTQRTQYFQLRALQEQTDQALGEVQGQLGQSETELNKVMDRNRSMEQQNVQFDNQFKELKQEISSLRSNLAQLDQEKDQLLMTLDEKTERIAALEREVRFKEQQATGTEQQIRDIQHKHQICLDQSAEQERQLRTMGVEMDNLQRQLAAASMDRENAIRENGRIQDDLAAVTCECRNLQRELEASRAESYDLKRQLQTYVSEVRRAEEMMNRKENERTEMLNHFRSLSMEATVLENNNQSLESEAAEARGALQTAQDRLLDLERQLADRDCLIRGYETQIAELTQSVASMETQLRQQGEQRKRAEADLNAVRDLCVKLDQQKESLVQQLDDKESMKAQCEAQLSRLKAEQNMVQDQMSRDHAAVDRLESLLAQARQEAMGNQAANQELQSEMSRLKQKIAELQDKLCSESNELRRYQNQAAEYSKQISELRRQMTNERFDRARKEEESRRTSQASSSRSFPLQTCPPCGSPQAPTAAPRPDSKPCSNWKVPATRCITSEKSEDRKDDMKNEAQRTNRFDTSSSSNLAFSPLCKCQSTCNRTLNHRNVQKKREDVPCINIILNPVTKAQQRTEEKQLTDNPRNIQNYMTNATCVFGPRMTSTYSQTTLANAKAERRNKGVQIIELPAHGNIGCTRNESNTLFPFVSLSHTRMTYSPANARSICGQINSTLVPVCIPREDISDDSVMMSTVDNKTDTKRLGNPENKRMKPAKIKGTAQPPFMQTMCNSTQATGYKSKSSSEHSVTLLPHTQTTNCLATDTSICGQSSSTLVSACIPPEERTEDSTNTSKVDNTTDTEQLSTPGDEKTESININGTVQPPFIETIRSPSIETIQPSPKETVQPLLIETTYNSTQESRNNEQVTGYESRSPLDLSVIPQETINPQHSFEESSTANTHVKKVESGHRLSDRIKQTIDEMEMKDNHDGTLSHIQPYEDSTISTVQSQHSRTRDIHHEGTESQIESFTIGRTNPETDMSEYSTIHRVDSSKMKSASIIINDPPVQMVSINTTEESRPARTTLGSAGSMSRLPELCFCTGPEISPCGPTKPLTKEELSRISARKKFDETCYCNDSSARCRRSSDPLKTAQISKSKRVGGKNDKINILCQTVVDVDSPQEKSTQTGNDERVDSCTSMDDERYNTSGYNTEGTQRDLETVSNNGNETKTKITESPSKYETISQLDENDFMNSEIPENILEILRRALNEVEGLDIRGKRSTRTVKLLPDKSQQNPGPSTMDSNSRLDDRNILTAVDFTRPEFMRMLNELKEHTCSLELQLATMNNTMKSKRSLMGDMVSASLRKYRVDAQKDLRSVDTNQLRKTGTDGGLSTNKYSTTKTSLPRTSKVDDSTKYLHLPVDKLLNDPTTSTLRTHRPSNVCPCQSKDTSIYNRRPVAASSPIRKQIEPVESSSSQILSSIMHRESNSGSPSLRNFTTTNARGPVAASTPFFELSSPKTTKGAKSVQVQSDRKESTVITDGKSDKNDRSTYKGRPVAASSPIRKQNEPMKFNDMKSCCTECNSQFLTPDVQRQSDVVSSDQINCTFTNVGKPVAASTHIFQQSKPNETKGTKSIYIQPDSRELTATTTRPVAASSPIREQRNPIVSENIEPFCSQPCSQLSTPEIQRQSDVVYHHQRNDTFTNLGVPVAALTPMFKQSKLKESKGSKSMFIPSDIKKSIVTNDRQTDFVTPGKKGPVAKSVPMLKEIKPRKSKSTNSFGTESSYSTLGLKANGQSDLVSVCNGKIISTVDEKRDAVSPCQNNLDPKKGREPIAAVTPDNKLSRPKEAVGTKSSSTQSGIPENKIHSDNMTFCENTFPRMREPVAASTRIEQHSMLNMTNCVTSCYAQSESPTSSSTTRQDTNDVFVPQMFNTTRENKLANLSTPVEEQNQITHSCREISDNDESQTSLSTVRLSPQASRTTQAQSNLKRDKPVLPPPKRKSKRPVFRISKHKSHLSSPKPSAHRMSRHKIYEVFGPAKVRTIQPHPLLHQRSTSKISGSADKDDVPGTACVDCQSSDLQITTATMVASEEFEPSTSRQRSPRIKVTPKIFDSRRHLDQPSPFSLKPMRIKPKVGTLSSSYKYPSSVKTSNTSTRVRSRRKLRAAASPKVTLGIPEAPQQSNGISSQSEGLESTSGISTLYENTQIDSTARYLPSDHLLTKLIGIRTVGKQHTTYAATTSQRNTPFSINGHTNKFDSEEELRLTDYDVRADRTKARCFSREMEDIINTEEKNEFAKMGVSQCDVDSRYGSQRMSESCVQESDFRKSEKSDFDHSDDSQHSRCSSLQRAMEAQSVVDRIAKDLSDRYCETSSQQNQECTIRVSVNLDDTVSSEEISDS